MAGAAGIVLKQPTQGDMGEPTPGPFVPKPKGVYASSASLEPSGLQDLVDVLPDVVKAAAGVPLRFQISISLGDGQEISLEAVERISKVLEQVSTELRLKA